MCLATKRNWRVLCWNVRGLNADDRQRSVRAKIEECSCDIVCLQETKCDSVDWRFIRKFAPKRFDNFTFSPSVGASGGMIMLWNSSVFTGLLIEVKRFGIMIKFTSVHDNSSWVLVCVYGPCQGLERDNFVSWLYNLQIPVVENWLLLGGF
jgi:exonuclease III